jgi:hypothetical protein
MMHNNTAAVISEKGLMAYYMPSQRYDDVLLLFMPLLFYLLLPKNNAQAYYASLVLLPWLAFSNLA